MGYLTISTTIGTLQPDPAEGNILHVAPGFGLTQAGTGYYDPDGAALGDEANLMITADGRWFLESSAGTNQGVEGIRLSDTPSVVLVEMRETPIHTGQPVHADTPSIPLTAMRETPIRTGRPVHIAQPTLREPTSGRPVAQHDPTPRPLRSGRITE